MFSSALIQVEIGVSFCNDNNSAKVLPPEKLALFNTSLSAQTQQRQEI